MRVVDLDLDHPLGDLAGLEGYASVTALIRLHGVPIVGVGGVLYVIGGSARSADVINWGRVFALQP